MGVPDNFTLLDSYRRIPNEARNGALEELAEYLGMNIKEIRTKGCTPDSQRYKSLGNSIAVPVLGWIGKRIMKALELSRERDGS